MVGERADIRQLAKEDEILMAVLDLTAEEIAVAKGNVKEAAIRRLYGGDRPLDTSRSLRTDRGTGTGISDGRG